MDAVRGRSGDRLRHRHTTISPSLDLGSQRTWFNIALILRNAHARLSPLDVFNVIHAIVAVYTVLMFYIGDLAFHCKIREKKSLTRHSRVAGTRMRTCAGYSQRQSREIA